MTTWVNGNVVPATWYNAVEQILALGAYGSVVSPRLTLNNNQVFDQGSANVATTLQFNGPVTVNGAGKQWEGLSFRQLSSTNTGAAAYATCVNYNHVAVLSTGAFAYNEIGILQCFTGDASTKASACYHRVQLGGTMAGTGVAGTFAVTYDTGASAGATSCLLNLERSGSNVGAWPIGIYFSSNLAGSIISNMMVIDASLFVGASVIQWNQRAGQSSAALFLQNFDSSSVSNFAVDALGNVSLRADATALSIGQRFTADMSNATHKLRFAFQTATAAGSTQLHVLPGSGGTVAGTRVFSASDPTNASYITMGFNTAGFLDSNFLGGGAAANMEIRMQGTYILKLNATTNDLLIGKSGAATGDTSGHHYIQAVAGAPTGVPTGYAGYVPMRYDSTNNFLYIYNGGWKKSTVYA